MTRRVVKVQNGLEGWRAKLECGHWVATETRKGPEGMQAECSQCETGGRDELGLARRGR